MFFVVGYLLLDSEQPRTNNEQQKRPRQGGVFLLKYKTIYFFFKSKS